MFHIHDESLWYLLNVAQFVINQCKTCDISDDTRFMINGIIDKLEFLKARVETKPF